MARKSRKNSFLAEMPVADIIEDEKIPTAIYGRLSIENGDSEDSMDTQIALIQEYIDGNDDLKYIDTYFDNGFTGTNFNRPAFNRLMDDVRKKKIRCIVVKDLSRFGRNYLEAGYYIETIFPFLGVRLIAVTDNFDSSRKEDMEGISVPIRNLINSMYAKDISKKIWTSMQRKKQAGFAAGNYAPFGYIRNPHTKRNEIDPEAAFYVRLIFQWRLMGVAINEISKRLDMLGAPTPRERQYQLGLKEKKCAYRWGVSTVKAILNNQAYVGDTVGNKTSQALFAGKSKTFLEESEWIITPNTHPAIIARDDFERVQDIMQEQMKNIQNRRNSTNAIRLKYQNEMPDVVYCMDCGARMDFERLPHGAVEDKKTCYYICKGRKQANQCRGHQITERLLKMLVMNQIHVFISGLSDKKKILQQLQQSQQEDNPLNAIRGEIISLTSQVNTLAEKRRKLYENYASGVVDMEEYHEIRNDYTKRYEKTCSALKAAEQRKMDIEEKIRKYLDMTKHLEEYLDSYAFNADLVKELIQKIEVSSENQIHIVFRFQDIFQELYSEERKQA